MVDIQAQYRHLEATIQERVQAVLAHGQHILGPEVGELEQQLADYVGVKHVISCANGTDAIQMALMAIEISPDDAVFCPSFTFIATAEAVSLAGATPVFVDSDSHSFNICPVDLEQKIKDTIALGSHHPKAIIAVDLFGLPAPYEELTALAEKYDLILIGDAAQSFGSDYQGNKSAVNGHLTTTSFFPAKPLGCYGDGGAIFTDNDDYADTLKSIRVHGKGTHKYDNVRLGMNSRLDTIQAAILLAKLTVFDTELSQRNAIAARYSDALSNVATAQLIPDHSVSAWAQYSFTVSDRDKARALMHSRDISTVSYYEKCIHKQAAYNGSDNGISLTNAEHLSASIMSVPMFPYLSEDAINAVCDALRALD